MADGQFNGVGDVGLALDDEARLLEFTLILPTDTDRREATESLSQSGLKVERENKSILVTDPWDIQVRLCAI